MSVGGGDPDRGPPVGGLHHPARGQPVQGAGRVGRFQAGWRDEPAYVLSVDVRDPYEDGPEDPYVAERLGYTHIDTGAMYRAVAWKAAQDESSLHPPRVSEAEPDRVRRLIEWSLGEAPPALATGKIAQPLDRFAGDA